MPENEPQRRRGKQSAETAAKTRQAIIDAATECFSRLGYEAASVREIAQVAQLTHGTLRHHFGGKLDIWKAVADNVLAYYQGRLMPILGEAEAAAPLRSFKRLVQAFIEASYANPVFAKLLMSESQTDNERASYVKANFLSLHQPIGFLFARAQSECSALKGYTNDSFFLALLSLTFFPIMVPGIQSLLTDLATATPADQVQRIMSILFHEPSD